jgi:hypothetical protein
MNSEIQVSRDQGLFQDAASVLIHIMRAITAIKMEAVSASETDAISQKIVIFKLATVRI